jgi:hypothetical protein
MTKLSRRTLFSVRISKVVSLVPIISAMPIQPPSGQILEPVLSFSKGLLRILLKAFFALTLLKQDRQHFQRVFLWLAKVDRQ